MNKFSSAFLAGAFLIGLSAPALADPWTIDFDTDTDGITPFASNTIFGNGDGTQFQRYTDGIAGANTGVTISASGGQDLAVGFDTRLTGTRDKDLQKLRLRNNGSIRRDGFNVVNDNSLPHDNTIDLDGPVPDRGYGNILIVQEVTCNGGGQSCNRADDNVGGSLTFAFDTAVTLLGMHVFDTEEGGGNVQFLDELGNEVANLAPLPNVGNEGVGFMEFGGPDGILAHTMIVTFSGSGAVDNIRGNSPTNISEPTAMALFGVGLVAMGVYRRRRYLETKI